MWVPGEGGSPCENCTIVGSESCHHLHLLTMSTFLLDRHQLLKDFSVNKNLYLYLSVNIFCCFLSTLLEYIIIIINIIQICLSSSSSPSSLASSSSSSSLIGQVENFWKLQLKCRLLKMIFPKNWNFEPNQKMLLSKTCSRQSLISSSPK